ncbi:hypothetical protein [Streptomyces sviceus]|uniref:hypothetical protein n=1 Tax=Streptomyces sviceus TaxID=285530 RepID=UPI0036E2FF60
MAQVTAALRNIAPRCGADPAAVLDEANTFLGRYHPERSHPLLPSLDRPTSPSGCGD